MGKEGQSIDQEGIKQSLKRIHQWELKGSQIL